MSVFGAGFDPRDQILGFLGLIEIDTPDGPARYMVAAEGIFRDIDGRAWVGSQLLQGTELEWSRGGDAPEGELSMSYFQDPDAADLISKVRALGAGYLEGRKVRYYVQPIRTMSDFYAPGLPMILYATRTAGVVKYTFNGDISRRISLSVESIFAGRRAARSRFYTVEDHSRLVGSPNPSLQFMPLESREEEALFG
ncbi:MULTISPECIES: hypothetical protein [unclassified Yoonia]|uniref:hypothetical protein n=1 Tax=unclassified Yoonia TaxID=2629118 RepID=UPI002AFE98D4|nr:MULTISPECIES: hypothetical protein [unclassified Yoonia]